MNWGMKIVLGLGTFMVLIVGAGIYMVTHDTDSLIDADYYKKSLDYDDVYQRKQNVVADNVKPVLKLEGDTLAISFSDVVNKGELYFKRPSNGNLDVKIPFYTATDIFRFPVSTFIKGNWSVEVVWENKGKKYLDNQALFL